MRLRIACAAAAMIFGGGCTLTNPYRHPPEGIVKFITEEPYLRGPDNNPLPPGSSQWVGSLNLKVTRYFLLWGFLTIFTAPDPIEEINRKMTDIRADGMISYEASEELAASFSGCFGWLGLLGIFPSAQHIEITGDFFRFGPSPDDLQYLPPHISP